jgi:hypothetical protein
VAGNLKSLASDHKTYALAMDKWFGCRSDEITAFGFLFFWLHSLNV